jgi:hypothetical protein
LWAGRDVACSATPLGTLFFLWNFITVELIIVGQTKNISQKIHGLSAVLIVFFFRCLVACDFGLYYGLRIFCYGQKFYATVAEFLCSVI